MIQTGVVVTFDKEEGFGFIRSREYPEDVFVHARVIAGGRMLRAGERVRFAAEPSARGPRAVRVEPKRPSMTAVALAPDLAVALGVSGWLLAAALALRFGLGWAWAWAWLAAVNPTTFAAFALDKRRAILGARRIPERALLALALLGGTPAAALAMPCLRHKTRKASFRLAFAAVVALQAAALGAWWWFAGR
jgi:uncharacterized membrane protein YsdA (DUF1294 family)/cold shock CspA family protein